MDTAVVRCEGFAGQFLCPLNLCLNHAVYVTNRTARILAQIVSTALPLADVGKDTGSRLALSWGSPSPARVLQLSERRRRPVLV